MLPDDVLLEIFDLCQETLRNKKFRGWEWHLLVHVCQRWRQIVFASPHRLNLRIRCTYITPVRKNLDIWPAFPIEIDNTYNLFYRGNMPRDEDNVIAALEHPDRVCHVELSRLEALPWGKLVTLLQEPFPVLTHLSISVNDDDGDNGNTLALPDEFLGESAPCLQEFNLSGFTFPALPTLLLSTSDLAELSLCRIPPTDISPEVMVACLATLPRLKQFVIGPQSATFRPHRIRPPPITRTVLPALTYFEFIGASEYLEDLVARIDGPQLDRICIHYLNQLVDFQVAQLSKFIDRSVGPKMTLFRQAEVSFSSIGADFAIRRAFRALSPGWLVETLISCEGIDWQVSHMAQVLSHFSATLSNVVHLRLEANPDKGRQEGTDDAEWLHLLHQFSTVQTLDVYGRLAGHVALALEDITGEMVAEVLPSLNLICLAGQPASSVEKFIAARELSGRPVTVIDTETEFNERLKSYAVSK